MIAETRAKISLDSPSSPVRPITQRITLSPERTISPINNSINQFIYGSMPKDEALREQSPARTTPPRGKSPLGNLSILDRISPKSESKVINSLILITLINLFLCSLKKRNSFNRNLMPSNVSKSQSIKRQMSSRRSCVLLWVEM